MVASIKASLLALLSILAVSTTLTNTVQAHSSAWPTITRSEHIHNLRHDILPRAYSNPLAKRNIDYSDIISRHDTIRLQFSAFNTTFHLYLEPNTELIHPNANLGPDVFPDDIKAFKGIVIQDEQHSDHKWHRAATTSRIAKRTVEHMLHEEGVLGWARMMVEHDADSTEGLILRGAFMINDDTYHITTRQNYHIQKRSDDASPSQTASGSSLIIYRDSDFYKPANLSRKKRGITADDISCGADHLNKTAEYIEATSSHDYYYPPDSRMTVPMMGGVDTASSWVDVLKMPLVKRDVNVTVAGPDPVPTGCPGVAADCAYVRSYGGQVAARKQIFADFNTASGIYESTFNVALGIIALNITSENCPTTPVQGEEWNQDCSTAYTIDMRLSDFSKWRGQGDRVNDGAGLWHLMTKCNSGSVVGIAWTKALCQMKSQEQSSSEGAQYTAGTGVSSITTNEWMVVAHEVGHGFGAIHDCTASTCPAKDGVCCALSSTTCDAGGAYIMNPSEQTATKVFSPCSIKAICGTIASSSGQCLKTPGTRETQSSEENICGNGIKETGEDCDCGSTEGCANDSCCDGTTCKFKNGAVCDSMNDDCCLNCQLRPAGEVCRKAISECDIEEVCTGTSATCPSDVKVADLTSCTGAGNMTGLQCANGVCTSRDLQCQQQDRTGITGQCEASTSCQLMCNDPNGNALSCTQIPGTNFIDGTPCGFGGTCSGGNCKYNGINGVLSWARSHLAIVIPVGCVVGLLLICCIWSCCCSRFFYRQRQRKMLRKPSARRPYGAQPGVDMAPGRFGSNAVHNSQHISQGYAMGPLPPPPVYHDPSVLVREREEEELQRALEESRREYERHSRTLAEVRQQPGATVASTPRVNEGNNPFGDYASSQYRPTGHI
ncbi:hypothetical protein BGX21_011495 [Mortierella sp. AD011]|nr:hypothetical protein BGX20_001880 [Mortierella sp. AD010]KAF9390307.1 hypothetical protein BGX21_011495 [Mortierella sp. AD011]